MKKKKKQGSRRLPPTNLPLPPADFQETVTESIDCSTTVFSSTMTPPASERFLESLKDYYNTAALSDAVVVCDDQEFKVHRVILSAHSKYFAAELNGSWKESSDRKIQIKDFDASVVEAMLRFMYSFDYSNNYGTSTMVYDAQVYQIADKYDIPALKAHCKSKFGAAITTGWSLDDFPLAITVAYASTPSEDRGLRDLAVEVSRKNIDKLLGHDGFCELLRKTPDFSADLIPFLSGKPSTNTPRYKCPSCHHEFRGEFSGMSYYCPNCSHKRSDWASYRIGD